MTNDAVPTPSVGARYLAPSGRIWLVRSITARRNRVVMVSNFPDGEHGAILDISAVLRMTPLDATVNEAASLGRQPGSDDRTPTRPAPAEMAQTASRQ